MGVAIEEDVELDTEHAEPREVVEIVDMMNLSPIIIKNTGRASDQRGRGQ